MSNFSEFLSQKVHDHYSDGHNVRGRIYNGLNNAYLRFDAARHSGAWIHPINTFRSYIREHSGYPDKYAEESIRPLVKSVSGYVNPKHHSKGNSGITGKEETNPWVDVVGRKRNMEGIKQVQYLLKAYNHNYAENGIEWKFDNSFNDSAGSGKLVHYTPTGKSLPVFRLQPTNESTANASSEQMQNSLNALSDYMSRYTDFGLDSFFTDTPAGAVEL